MLALFFFFLIYYCLQTMSCLREAFVLLWSAPLVYIFLWDLSTVIRIHKPKLYSLPPYLVPWKTPVLLLCRHALTCMDQASPLNQIAFKTKAGILSPPHACLCSWNECLARLLKLETLGAKRLRGIGSHNLREHPQALTSSWCFSFLLLNYPTCIK